jgi:phosphotransacetylase
VAEVQAPEKSIFADDVAVPEVALRRGGKFDRLLRACEGVPAMPTAVVAPTDENSLGGAWEAAKAKLIEPLLVGPEQAIRAAADRIGWDLAGARIVAVADDHAAPARAVALVHEGEAASVMKGNIHSDEVLRHVTKADGGLRTGRRISHCFVLDVPGREGLMLISDAAINILPDLVTKADIVQNAIDLVLALSPDRKAGPPRVAILSAVETVTPKIPGTIDAAALCKMADRGQITGGLVDGPLALDNAISPEAAQIKGIKSEVAGRAQILVVPDLEAGNMLAKNLSFLANADAAGIVLGARVPIVLTSRADSVRTRMASCAVATIYAHARRQSPSVAAAG